MSVTPRALLLAVTPWVLAGGALAAVALQASSISSLEARVAGLESARPRAAAPPNTPPPQARLAPQPAAEAPPPDDRVAALLARVDHLEREQARAPRVVAHAVGEGAAPEAVADDVAALRADVDTLLTGDGFDSADTKKKLLGLVEEAVDQRRRKFEQAREEATRQRASELAAELGLDDAHAAALGDLAVALRGARRGVMERVRGGELDMREARAEAQAQQETIRTQVRDLLTPEQYAKFEAEFPERGRGWGGRRGDERARDGGGR